MEILLARHGAKDDGPAEPDTELSGHGRHQAEQLARALRHRGCVIDGLLSSRSLHARQTAQLLRAQLGAGRIPIHLLDALTPGRGPGDVDTLLDQAIRADPSLASRQVILVVGHEGRLSDLLTDLTATRWRPFGHGEAVCVTGQCLSDLAAGRGEIRFRYPAYDHLEEPLRSKVQSKMTISTFLAGFVFTALSALLLLTPPAWTAAQVIAVVSLTASLSLFIACVYLYDQLSMPSGFWTDAPGPRLWRRWHQRLERRQEERWHEAAALRGADEADELTRPLLQDGPRYHSMISTSRLLFVPATWLALAGFAALLAGTGNPWMMTGAGAGLLLSSALGFLRRPGLGAD